MCYLRPLRLWELVTWFMAICYTALGDQYKHQHLFDNNYTPDCILRPVHALIHVSLTPTVCGTEAERLEDFPSCSMSQSGLESAPLLSPNIKTLSHTPEFVNQPPTYSRYPSAQTRKLKIRILVSSSNVLGRNLKYLATSKRRHPWSVHCQEVQEDPGKDLAGGGTQGAPGNGYLPTGMEIC